MKDIKQELEKLLSNYRFSNGRSAEETYLQLMEQAYNLGAESNPWRKYPADKPLEYGKYEVYRMVYKKQHYQSWNNTGFAYGNKDITHWREIEPPIV